ncbi:putative NRPS-like protein biosynthetic cluster [Pleurotus pulmonarius]|nr:putative NRPS-like protein biosynthetic cluster [Pleurotus pulmonarius]
MRKYPPTDGTVLLSEVVDFNVKHNPMLPMYVYADENDGHSVTITHLEFARACHRIAWTILPSGPRQNFGGAVAIIALCDSIVYQALMLGVHKTGMTPYPISPRNSPAAVVKLLKETNCHRIISTSMTMKPLLDAIRQQLASDGQAFSVDVEEVPPLNVIFPLLGAEIETDSFVPYPEYPVRPELSTPALYLHSSGSTGMPKTITLTQRAILHWARLPPVTDIITQDGPSLLAAMALPPFHTLAIYAQVLAPLFSVRPVVLYPPVRKKDSDLPLSPTPDNILDHTRRTKCDSLIVIPTLLHVWSHSPESMNFLRSLRIVTYSGGSPPPKLGEALSAAGVVTRPIYGATEFGAPTHWVPSDSERTNGEWQWIRFCDNVSIDMVPQGDGTYELCVVRGETDHINVFNMADKAGYATSDLFTKHPTKEGLWKIVGRKDDVIVHTTGEKTVPTPLEDIITSHPGIQGVVMFGAQQNQPGVLIELKDTTRFPQNNEDLKSIRNELWPIIEEANAIAPAFSRIYKDMVIFASPDKPLPRAGKGTIMRKAALVAYAPEIENLYNSIEGAKSSTISGPESWSEDNLHKWLAEQIADLVPNTTISPTKDFSEQGLDSLIGTLLRRRIVGALQSRQQDVPQTLVYDYPSIEKLASALAKFHSGSELSLVDRASLIDSAIETHISRFEPMRSSNVSTSGTRGAVALLTGSTGGLGSFILSNLLKNDHVAMVYTLNRAGVSPIDQRQRKSFEERGLDTSLLDLRKLVSLEGDLTRPDLGLQSAVYDNLKDIVTHIFHNAWMLDFNFPLSAFDPLIAGSVNLINLARRGPHPSATRFLFSSSVSAVQSWNSDTPVPEEPIFDSNSAVGLGYGESKYVVERILAASGLASCSMRIGQVCGGDTTGAWSINDWVPIMIKTSLTLNVLPNAKGLVSWVPMDTVAQTAMDIAFADDPLPSTLNIVHPRPIKWSTLFVSLKDAIQESTRGTFSPRLVSFQEWFNILKSAADRKNHADDLRQLPALKILAFFQHVVLSDEHLQDTQESGGFPAFETKRACQISPMLRDAKQLDKVDASRWVGYWINEGLLG